MMADMTDRTGGGQRSEVTDAAPSPSWSFDGARRDGKTVVVLDGDSLWSIAANRLGTGSTALYIGAEWPRWYAANRDVIGDDANLILPGQLLNPPAPRAAP
jgi:nucleoid-associated protein YgaU